jgi:ribosomal-protein-alanine N-acetyltransferase
MSIEDAFAHLPSFNTERLIVRPMEDSDVEAMFAIKSDPKVAAAYGAEPHRSIEETQEWVEGRVSGSGREDSLFWVFVPKWGKEAIGSCCYWHFDWESKCAELGYELHRSYWGKGIMTEALAPVLAYGLEGVGLNRIEACPLAENDASNALLLKLGFKYEGNLRERVFFKGRFVDQCYYSLLKSEWNSKTMGIAGPEAV